MGNYTRSQKRTELNDGDTDVYRQRGIRSDANIASNLNSFSNCFQASKSRHILPLNLTKTKKKTVPEYIDKAPGTSKPINRGTQPI